MDAATLRALTEFPDNLESMFNAFPPADVNRAPESWEGIPSESLTAIEQICHLRDIEIEGYQVRIRRLLREANPTLVSLDSYVLAKERAYTNASPANVLAAFRAARNATLDMIRQVRPDEWNRSGVFEGYGPVTLRGVVHFLCSHDQQHLAGLQWLLGKMESRCAITQP